MKEGDLISKAATLDAIFDCFNIMESKGIYMTAARMIVKGVLDGVPAVDAAPVVRCKDCKHRPIDYRDKSGDYTGFSIEFPDDSCPCQCEDGWYNWYPEDNWYCANGETLL